jgi:hypothetical protein
MGRRFLVGLEADLWLPGASGDPSMLRHRSGRYFDCVELGHFAQIFSTTTNKE